ncbi:MAG TPA: STAS domain-containing protein [Candidatus Ozemobacteraceae bacterium]|nr:STAS domain-containing protein [Candidatus Ozemobacteraceae bacterium]
MTKRDSGTRLIQIPQKDFHVRKPEVPASAPTASSSYSFIEEDRQGTLLITIHGYFNDQAGRDLSELVNRSLRGDGKRFVFDFQHCSTINSMGVAELLEITLRITEDFKGQLVLSALKPFMADLLTLAYVIPAAQVAPDIESALERLVDG